MKVFLAVCSVILIVAVLAFSVQATMFRDGFIRLHILAKDDSAVEQERKLALRDAILAEYGERLSVYRSRNEAEEGIRELLSEITSFCDRFLFESGSNDVSTVTLTSEYYPDREYENVTLPAGKYLSLRVKIGDGAGKNWWCVLYPPLCLSLACDDSAVPTGMTKATYETVRNDRAGKYVIRFKIFDLFGKLFK